MVQSEQRSLAERMRRLGIREEDVEERFIRSSGPGGQRVNKVATCVVLRHRPTGLEVRCQQERSQAVNRYLARALLLDRIEAQHVERLRAEAQRIAKLRRQKRRRPARVTAQLVEAKRRHARAKSLRRPPRSLEE